jgi:hypothetical protein
MTINQVQLSNTFNEFRQTVNNISNTLNAFTDTPAGPGEYSTQSVHADGLFSNTLNISTLTNGRVALVGASGLITDDSGISYNSSTDRLTVTNLTATTQANLNSVRIEGSTTVTATTTFGSGANTTVIHAANGNLHTTDRIDAYHVHASEHLAAGGDVENWATDRGDNAETHKVAAIANTNAAVDMLIVNKSEGDGAYAEFIAIHATGNTTDGWTSFGINSSNYAEGAYGVTKADDAYILYQAPANTVHSGDLVIGTGSNGTGNKIIFSANGFDDPANNTQLVINPGLNVHVEIDTESSNTTTGALTVNGGIGLVGNLNVGGNVSITGTITLGGGGNTVSTDSLAVDNPIIYLGANNAADVLDLGVVGTYNDGTEKYVGLVRDATDGVIKFFANTSTQPTTTVNFSDSNLVYPSLKAGALELTDTTASSSKTTGALIVAGGLGVAGAVYANTINVNTGATVDEFSTDGTLAGSSNTAIPTEYAVKYYVDNYAVSETWTTANTTLTATTNDAIFADTSSAAFTINLPASPSLGDGVRIVDVAGTFAARNVTVGRANTSHKIMGATTDVALNINNASVKFVWSGATYGWRLV